MPDGTGEDLPRLPPRLSRDVPAQQLALDLLGMAQRPSPHLDADWPPFEEPSLVPLHWSRRAIVFARVLALAWGLAVVLFALRVRSKVENGDSAADTSIDRIARLGVVAVAIVALTGWLWCDRVTRNLHRLGGRLPGRPRCLSAWSLPLAWAAILWLTVLRMEPTGEFDVRPTIVVTLVVLSIWRPYSLVRRIVATLSRLRSDGLIGAGYVFDLSAYGLLWWQLASWPSPGTPVTAGRTDALLGVSAAAVVCLALNIGAWTWLTHNVRVAQIDRVLALRTRHDHRELRLRGINPMDPEIRWALLRIRQEEELERFAAAEREQGAPEPEPTGITVVADSAPMLDDDRSTVSAGPSADVPPLVTEIVTSDARHEIIADLVAHIASAETQANKIIADLVEEAADDANSSLADTSMGQLAAALSNLPTRPGAPEESDVAESTEPVDGSTTDVVEEPAKTDTAPVPAEAVEVDDIPEQPAPAAARGASTESFSEVAARLRSRLRSARDEHARPTTVDPVSPRTAAEDRAARLAQRFDSASQRGDHSAAPLVARTVEGTGELAHDSASRAADSLVARLAHEDNGAGGEDAASRIDRLAGRLGATGPPQPRSLLARLEEYGIRPDPTANEPLTSLADEFRREEERWIPPRLYQLEAVRYLLLVGIAAVSLTSAWIVTRTVSAGDGLVNGEIAPADLESINIARRAFVTTMSVSLTLVSLWGAVFMTHARRAGKPDTREWRAYVLLALGALLNVLAFVTDGDDRGAVSLMCTGGCLAAALGTVAIVAPAARWFERRSLAMMFWAAGLASVAVVSWIGGLQAPVEASDALGALTFVAAVQAIAAAVVVVIAALNTSDFEDAIRLSPNMTEPR